MRARPSSEVELGVTVIRTWGFSDGPKEWNAMQRAPGVYNERTFVGRDIRSFPSSRSSRLHLPAVLSMLRFELCHL